MNLCRRCGKKQAATTDGFCWNCKHKEVLRQKLQKFGRRQKAVNRIMSGGLASG